MDGQTRERLVKLVRMLGSGHLGERDNAWRTIDRILRRHGRSWAELPDLLHIKGEDRRAARRENRRHAHDQGHIGPIRPPLEQLASTLAEYLQLQDHDYLALALWIVHTFVYDQFMVTPRLALVSPVRRCGKTTALSLLAALCDKGKRFDGLSAAAIYRLVDRERPTLLCDEVDTYGLQHDGLLRSVFNSGHRLDGSIARAMGDRVTAFSTFAPMAVAAIGAISLPLTVLDRSIIVRMSRADGTRVLKRFDEASTLKLAALHEAVRRWSSVAVIDRDPDMPLRNRAADNWRPLLAIADACGAEWGKRARDAAIILSRGLQEEDPAVMLLSDIRDIFDARKVDRLSSQSLAEALGAMDDAPWPEWRGIRSDQQARAISPTELAKLLAPFDIKPRSIWPVARTPESRSHKGYLRQHFETAWGSYCGSDAGRAKQNNALKVLRTA